MFSDYNSQHCLSFARNTIYIICYLEDYTELYASYFNNIHHIRNVLYILPALMCNLPIISGH